MSNILVYDVIHLKLTLIGWHFLLVCPVNQPESKTLPLSALPAATLRPDLLIQLPWHALFPTWQWSMFAKISMVSIVILESLVWGFRNCAYFSDLLPIYWDIWTYRFLQSAVEYWTSPFIIQTSQGSADQTEQLTASRTVSMSRPSQVSQDLLEVWD